MKWLILALMLISYSAFAKTIRVAIIDTGMSKVAVQPCKTGHKDFTNTTIYDRHGHGSNISALIDMYADGADYCQVILKYFDPKVDDIDNLRRTILAFEEAINLKVDVINYSAGGKDYSPKEAAVVKRALDAGIYIIAAAGNEQMNFDNTGCKYFPACVDSRIVTVGCRKEDGSYCTMSNYGKGVKLYANGNLVSAGGYTLTGTSQATAIITGRFIKYWDKREKL